jgi:hypothetical protein
MADAPSSSTSVADKWRTDRGAQRRVMMKYKTRGAASAPGLFRDATYEKS